MSDSNEDNGSLASAEYWEAAANGWALHQEFFRRFTAPVSERLVNMLALEPGQRVLELAAGIGDTGFLAAARILPGGVLVCSDRAESMLSGARARAQELGIDNVEFSVLDAEWIDLPVASVDRVLCRWGYMLMTDIGAALRETRRVLRPDGKLALAAWDSLAHNPWAREPGAVLAERGLTSPSAADGPGPFALGDSERLRTMLADAGFGEIEIDAIDLVESHSDFDSFFDIRLDISRSFHDAVMSQPEAVITEIRAELQDRLAQYTAADGSLAIPGRTLVAVATA